MRAVRVYFDDNISTDQIGGIVEQLNDFPDTTATMCDRTEIFVAAVGQCAMQYVKAILMTNLRDTYTIKDVK